MPNGDPIKGDDKVATPPAEVTIEVDGEKKTYKAEDVQNLVSQQASATQKTQAAAPLLDAAEKYGIEPGDYVERSEGAFNTIVGLIDAGVLDSEGKVVKKEADVDKPVKKVDDPVKPVGDDSKASKELEETKTALEKLEERTKRVEDESVNLMRKNLEREVMKKHSELTKDDVSKLFGIAMANQNKDVWQHAEEFVEKKKEAGIVTRSEYAKEFGVDLKEFDANKIKEQDAKGGGAAGILGGRKLSFRPKKGETGTVTPKQAMKEFLSKQGV